MENEEHGGKLRTVGNAAIAGNTSTFRACRKDSVHNGQIRQCQGVRKLPEGLLIRLHDALVSGDDKRGAKGTDSFSKTFDQ